MTVAIAAGAPLGPIKWDAIHWPTIHDQVRRLQVRIAKAAGEGDFGKVKALQWILTHSWHAKLWAVRRVTTNKGAKTPGVDGVTWRTGKKKIAAALALKRLGYIPQPLRRIFIPKRNGKLRPLGIPTMHDRAMQALFALALEPVAEVLSDRNSYGFRQRRSTTDAVSQLFIVLGKTCSAQWVLDADIKACFDCISHDWLIANIPMDSKTLRAWLKAGFVNQNAFHHTDAGTPQGGIISPILANMALDGLEDAIQEVVPRKGAKVNLVRYADDFVITAATRELLEDAVLPVVAEFLAKRGLALSSEKTKIVHIDQGFDFLGCNVRKYDGKLSIRPAKKSVLSFMQSIREFIRSQVGAPTVGLLARLNAKIRGWGNYYRHVISSKTFGWCDWHIAQALTRWIRRRHKKSETWKWRRKHYYRQPQNTWLFSTTYRLADGRIRILDLFQLSSIKWTPHVKVRATAHAFDPEQDAYFAARKRRQRCRIRVERQFLSWIAA
jgi:RNA-directed DNA polymerase